MTFTTTYINHKVVLRKVLKTFIQAFLGVFILGLTNLFNVLQNGTLNALKSGALALVGAALAAGIAAIWNYYLQATT